jgi:hypothetical protein
MPEPNAVLFFNEAFYAASENRNVAAMKKIWAKDKINTCTHP